MAKVAEHWGHEKVAKPKTAAPVLYFTRLMPNNSFHSVIDVYYSADNFWLSSHKTYHKETAPVYKPFLSAAVCTVCNYCKAVGGAVWGGLGVWGGTWESDRRQQQ